MRSSSASTAAWLEGMGLIVLHSGHYSKIFKRLMGTRCELKWREAGERERLWIIEPDTRLRQVLASTSRSHTRDVRRALRHPSSHTLVFLSWFQGGEVFRSGCCWHRGAGKIFYFRPGHETFPIFYQPEVQRVLANAVRWAAPVGQRWIDSCPNVQLKEAREKLVAKGPRLHREGEEGFR